jgi:methionyl aminopeptidase
MTESVAKKNGYEVVKDFTGHGCGNFLHEDPMIPNYGKKNEGIKLKKGMVICIEPMLLTGSDKYNTDKKNGWTITSTNHKLTCHNEHMILVTEDGYEILTQTD